jgi:hypothetical protein
VPGKGKKLRTGSITKKGRDATKKRRKRARGPREEDQVDEYFPQPSNIRYMNSESNAAHSASTP